MAASPLVAVMILGVCVGGSGVFGTYSEPAVVRTPEERFSHLPHLGYPWPPRYLYLTAPDLPQPLRVHYIDQGPRDALETVLLLHGTPAWSFLYRTMIPVFLGAGYRVVALDQIGFGRSDKLTDPEAYSHFLHVATVEMVVRSLDLWGVTAVLQDLGGPTGVSAIRRDPGRYRRIVLLNTWLPVGDVFYRPTDHSAYLAWRSLVTLLGRRSPIQTVFKVASDAPSEAVEWGYGAPYPSYIYQAGPSIWPRMIPLTKTDPVALEMKAAAYFLQSGWEGPTLLAYSDGEVITLAGKDFLQQILLGACEAEVPDAGHFLQEDQGPYVAHLIINFINYGCDLVYHNI